MKRVLHVGLATLAGAAVTTVLWPAWYDVAPVIPLSERLARIAMAVAPGVVVTSVGLQLLAGLPLVSWFATWTHNLATGTRSKSPVAAWRELKARDEASRRWQERGNEPADAQSPARATHDISSGARLYANVARDYHERGDEDGPEYRPILRATSVPGRLPSIAITPAIERFLGGLRRYAQRTGRVSPRLDLLRARIQEAHRSGQITFEESLDLWNAIEWQVRSAAARHARPKIARRRDGIQLGDRATQDLLDRIFGPEEPNA